MKKLPPVALAGQQPKVGLVADSSGNLKLAGVSRPEPDSWRPVSIRVSQEWLAALDEQMKAPLQESYLKRFVRERLAKK